MKHYLELVDSCVVKVKEGLEEIVPRRRVLPAREIARARYTLTMDEIREIERGLEADPENPHLKKRLSSLCARNRRLFDGHTLGDLCEALTAESSERRREALHSLGSLDHYAFIAIPKIIKAFGDEDLFVRSAALEALQKIDPKADESLKHLIQCLGQGPHIQREALIKFLLGSGDNLRSFPGPLIHALEQESHKPVLKKLIAAVILVGEAALPELLNSLEADRARYPENLAEALGALNMASPEVVDQLLRALNHKRPKARLAAARAYAKLTGDYERSLTIYNEVILSSTDHAPLAVIYLRELGDVAKEARSTLLEGLKQSGPERIQCAYTLIELGLDLDKAIPVASAGMNALAPFVSLQLARRSAEDALGAQAQTHLLSWIQRPEAALRAEAFKLLGVAVTQSNKDDSPVLMRLLEQEDPELKLGVLETLQRVPAQAAKCIPQLLELRHEQVFLRPLLRILSIIRNACGVEPYPAIDFITECLDHEDKEVVASAAMTFSVIKDSDAKVLAKFFQLYHSEDPLIRLSVEPCLISTINNRSQFFYDQMHSPLVDQRARAFRMYFRFLERLQMNESAREHYFGVIQKGIEDPDKSIRDQAAHILTLYGPAGFDALKAGLVSERLEIRLTALYYLPRFSGYETDCFPIFLKLLKDRNIEIRVGALGALRLINESVETLQPGVIKSLCQFYSEAGFIEDQVKALISEIVSICLNYIEYPFKVDDEDRRVLVKEELRALKPCCFDSMDRVEAALNKSRR